LGWIEHHRHASANSRIAALAETIKARNRLDGERAFYHGLPGCRLNCDSSRSILAADATANPITPIAEFFNATVTA
jgi:hypothetical protein